VKLVVAVVAVGLLCAMAASGAVADQGSSMTIRLISEPSGFESFADRPPVGVDSKGDFYRAGSVLRNAVSQFGKPRGARVGSDDFLVKFISARQQRVRGRTTLPGGLLKVEIIIRAGQSDRLLPIAGGTGVYEGARGTVETRPLPGVQRALNIYRLTLP
jgi:hypothetical protein